jgi:hypothetical protein
MIFRQTFLEGIRTGAITVAFRRWRRPSVRAGGTLLTPVGQLTIKSVKPVALNRISAADAHRAGYESREALVEELQRRTEGEIYRIELGPLRADPRLALRKKLATTRSVPRICAIGCVDWMPEPWRGRGLCGPWKCCVRIRVFAQATCAVSSGRKRSGSSSTYGS